VEVPDRIVPLGRRIGVDRRAKPIGAGAVERAHRLERARRRLDEDAAPIAGGAGAADEVLALQPIDQRRHVVWSAGAGVALGSAVAATLATPRRVSYTEEMVVDAPVGEIYDHIRFQERLMRWSAWPSETGSACACEGPDGEVGARTVFFTKTGARFGHQEVTALEPGRRVELRLESKGPPQRPVLAFELEPLGDSRTRVTLRFDNRIAWPFNAVLRLAGVVRWTREMHRKDLAGLKRYAEPPHRTYTGEPATEPARAA
jgi:hypothetical protein